MWILLLPIVLARDSADANLNFVELSQKYGFNVSTYEVTTKDGYILTLYRIHNEGPPVLMMHGLLDCADTWIVNDPDIAPGFQIARAGFDVWFGNSRGSTHSKAHQTLNPEKDAAFWAFSFQEMGWFDLPANIDFILEQTGKEKLLYVGHSQGTAQMFVLLSDYPEWADKLSLFVGLGPVTAIPFATQPILKVVENTRFLQFLNFLGIHEILPYIDHPTLVYYACRLFGLICDDVVEYITALQTKEDNFERFPVMLAHEPGGSSVQDLEYWLQLNQVKSPEHFPMFDYGDNNMEVYHQPTPPNHDLSKVRVPTALYRTEGDVFSDEEDFNWIVNQIGTDTVFHTRTDLLGGHLTYMWGKNLTFYGEIIDLLKEYAQQLVEFQYGQKQNGP